MDEIECVECNGDGVAEMIGGYLRPCDACHGEGWREPTKDEADQMAEDAYTRQFEGEPPLSAAERDEMQRRRDAAWGVK